MNHRKQLKRISLSCSALFAVLAIGVMMTRGSETDEIQQSNASQWTQGTYIWDSVNLLDQAKQDKELRLLYEKGMSELLIGLTGGQVKRGYSTKKALIALLNQAHKQGLKVKLLLGDPQWILPAQRHQLLELINDYRRIPFDGLHLDLEPEQLGWPVPKQQLQNLTHTIEEVTQISPWPVSLSIHPRWFEPMDRHPGEEFCLPCGLEGLENINLMIYQREANDLLARVKKITQRWPNLHFRLAQSVEDELGPKLSWHGKNSAQLKQQVLLWKKQLHPAGISGVDWQDWHSYPKEVRP